VNRHVNPRPISPTASQAGVRVLCRQPMPRWRRHHRHHRQYRGRRCCGRGWWDRVPVRPAAVHRTGGW